MSRHNGRAHHGPRLVPAVLALGVLAGSLAASPLVGSWAATGGSPRMDVKGDGTLTWDGQPYRYQVQGNVLIYQGSEGQGMAQFQVQGDQLVMAGPDIGTVQLARVASGAPALPATVKGASVPTGAPGNPAATRNPSQAPAPQGGQWIKQQYGFAMTPGQGWLVKETEEAAIFASKTIPGLILITVSEDPLTPDTVEAIARDGYQEGTTDLKPRTPGKFARVPTGMGQGYYFRVDGKLEGKDVAGFAGVYLPPGGQPIIALAVVDPKKAAELEPSARAMLSSVRLSKPFSPEVMEWDQDLRGYKVTYMWSYYSGGGDGAYVGGDSNKDWHLCKDGTYWYQGANSIAADGGGGSSGYGYGGANEAGRWEIKMVAGQGPSIFFYPQGGSPYSYTIYKKRKYASNYMQTHWGDMKVFAAEYAQCN